MALVVAVFDIDEGVPDLKRLLNDLSNHIRINALDIEVLHAEQVLDGQPATEGADATGGTEYPQGFAEHFNAGKDGLMAELAGENAAPGT